MLICICICLLVIFSTLNSSGLHIASAADASSELWLVDNVNYALVNGERVQLSEDADLSPYKNDTGTMYLPLSVIAQYAGATYELDGDVCVITRSDGSVANITVGSPAWTLDGVSMTDFLIPVTARGDMPFISILMSNDIFGLFNYYDSSMGLLIFGKQRLTGYSTSYSSMKSQIKTVCNMIMDRPSADQVFSDLEENVGATTHPRLLIDQDQFDKLREIYLSDEDADKHKMGIISQVNSGKNIFRDYFVENDLGEVEWKSEDVRISLRQPYYLYDENGNRLVGETSYTYTDLDTGEEVTLTLEKGNKYADGYDVGGRSNVGAFTSKLKSIAFAWQITGEDKFADAFYLFAKELDKWEHWGEGHFLNVADGSYDYAIGFDWIYHAFDDEPEKRAELADILYRKGVMMGFYSIKYDANAFWMVPDEVHKSGVVGTGGFRTKDRNNNWQTVCGAGMIVSALALCEYEEYRTNALYVIENYVKNVEKCLLQYAPDGSYPESPGYWEYGTNALMNTLIAFETSCGTSYGYKDVLGLHESYYFAAGIANSDYQSWNYHDAGRSIIDCKYFYLAAKTFDDANLAAFRDVMIFDRDFSMALMDVLFYDPSLVTDNVSMPLDNNFKGIHTATFRSSWDSGAAFTGLHVGPSHSSDGHGDFDTGNFVLSMGGYDWCIDPGTEDYNTPGFWSNGEGNTRYRLYRKSLEGHNSIIIHSSELVHGQKYVSTTAGGFPTINTFYSDENGGFAISNMKGQYGSTCDSAYRGVLMTNSRKTVILQDEISFNSPTSLTWVVNMSGYLQIVDSGKTVLATQWVNGEKLTLRATLLSDDDSLIFRKLGAYETVLDNTIIKETSGIYGTCNPETRIAIEAKDVTSFNVGVVFELIRSTEEIVGYSKVPMSLWTTCTSEWLDDANSGIIDPEPGPTYKYGASFFALAIDEFKNAGADWARYREIIDETSIYLTDYDPNNTTVQKLVSEYKKYVGVYNEQVDYYNQKFMESFIGVMPSKDGLKQ